MRHPTVDKLEQLIDAANEALEEAINLAETCLDKGLDVKNDYTPGELLADLVQAQGYLDKPLHQFTEIYWKKYKKKPIEDMTSAY